MKLILLNKLLPWFINKQYVNLVYIYVVVCLLALLILFSEIIFRCLELPAIEGVAISLTRRENDEGVGRSSTGQ